MFVYHQITWMQIICIHFILNEFIFCQKEKKKRRKKYLFLKYVQKTKVNRDMELLI